MYKSKTIIAKSAKELDKEIDTYLNSLESNEVENDFVLHSISLSTYTTKFHSTGDYYPTYTALIIAEKR